MPSENIEMEIIESDPFDQLYEHENRINYLEDRLEMALDYIRLIAKVIMYFPVEPSMIPDLPIDPGIFDNQPS